ncbi:MAG: dihydrofolate reductase family protein [Defluviitaleaceae bacterium]|nr:dihydrofolate reductase family protein [Defluviitaleaceae bacterium]
MKQRPITTLFMLMSADGKISTGATDDLDFDKDFPRISGVSEGLHQYYEIEQTTDLWSLNSGRVQSKVGVNNEPFPKKTAVSFVLIDNTHLNEHGVEYFSRLSKKFVLVTANADHAAYKTKFDNVSIIFQEKLNLQKLLEDLYENHGCEKITIQTGGTLNEIFLRNKLFNYVDIIIAPVLVGGKETSSLIDGAPLLCESEFYKLGILQLESSEVLENSYIRVRYRVIG